MKTYRAGIDVGSTTVKLVILDENDQSVYKEYRRHQAHIQEILSQLLKEAREVTGPCRLNVRITGSGSINLGKAMGIGFVQEVVAVATALQTRYPQTDVAIELGGEDAKIIYFTGGLEERMNGVCAGGTGSFIDQMAALLQTDAMGLNDAAADYEELYPIAARCGVFAKTDIQPLINEGAKTSDLAASIFQAVVNQTISGLACGKPIRGCVAFLGGPLHFLPELRNAFIRTLKLTDENIVAPDDSHLFAAMGAALEAKEDTSREIDEYITALDTGIQMQFELKRLESLFKDQDDYQTFLDRHQKAVVKKGDLASYEGNCFLGIDAGSTTTKLALIGEDGSLLYSFYANNQGNPILTATRAMDEIRKKLPEKAVICRSCSTGYGEALLKAAFHLDEGEVETIAHTTAAEFFDPQVDCVLDIGGQDMKCIKLRNHSVSNVMLNEACSSGCGSFIENFAVSMGYDAPGFAHVALFAKNPVDLGTRCTVFMNSNVKQAQKEGADISDISAGLAYSVIKNALFKVIKLANAEDLGKRIVVQGGTFYNHAVLRAFEKITGVEAICPDISGIMGAFGAALIAKNRYIGQSTSMLSLDQIQKLTYSSTTTHCKGCENSCMLTVNKFSDGSRYITGNRCEKMIKNSNSVEPGPNIFAYKKQRMFDVEPLSEEEAERGVIGIPRALNMYENYPFWATFFKDLKFRVVTSPFSSRKIYELGMESIPSESECYPAKISHGHAQWLINHGIKTIFHPCIYYEHKEVETADNQYNCPIVAGYAENLKNNIEEITRGDINYVRPFLSFANEEMAEERLVDVCKKEWNIPDTEVRAAAKHAWKEQRRAKDDIRAEGKRVLQWMEENGKRGIVLAGRPYHVDPEINHGIPELVASYGFAVFTEDSLPVDFNPERPLRVVDQWMFHSRLYAAAEFIRSRNDMEMIQLNSFGCGLDAVTTDQVAEILEGSNKIYTVLKIDEVNNLGAARIRIRSLLAAMNLRASQHICAIPKETHYERTIFTKEMFDAGYTIIAPDMSPIHMDLVEPAFRKYGYNLVILRHPGRPAIDMGLKYVNNDACYPSIVMVGMIMEAVLSGEYDTNRLAVMMTQTGGCCRASNYVGFIRKALDKCGLSHIPVISLNANGMEKNPGFKINVDMVKCGFRAVIYGDLIMKCLYRTRPYELVPGSAEALHQKWYNACVKQIMDPRHSLSYKQIINGIVSDFDNLPIHEDMKKPRVGIVGEILVKYMPFANNHLVDLLEREGAEAIVPDFADFFIEGCYGKNYRYKYLSHKMSYWLTAKVGVGFIEAVRKPAAKALQESRRFSAPVPMKQIADYTKPFLSLGNQYGEGWFLTGEMVELIEEGVPNIVCIQPFACLPNHVVGKGVIKQVRAAYPQANIAAVDYDPGASEVNQLNRIKLMLSSAKKALEKEN